MDVILKFLLLFLFCWVCIVLSLLFVYILYYMFLSSFHFNNADNLEPVRSTNSSFRASSAHV